MESSIYHNTLNSITVSDLESIINNDEVSVHLYIRHAHSLGNLCRCTTGSSFLPLTRAGKRSLIAVSENLKPLLRLKIWKYATSNMKRARQTALAIFGDQVDIEISPSLNEVHGGLCSNMPRVIFDLLWPKFFAPNEDFKRKYPLGGESHLDMYQRMLKFMQERHHEKRLAIVTHHGPIGSVLFWTSNIDAPSVYKEAVTEHSVSNLEVLAVIKPDCTSGTNPFIYKVAFES